MRIERNGFLIVFDYIVIIDTISCGFYTWFTTWFKVILFYKCKYKNWLKRFKNVYPTAGQAFNIANIYINSFGKIKEVKLKHI